MSGTAYPLVTDRLTLRFPVEADVPVLTAYRNDPRVAALQDWDLPYPEENAHALVEAHAGRTDLEPGRAAQVMIERDGELVGDLYVGLDEHGGVAEIGFSLVPEAQGKGIAHEAAAAVVDDLVDRLGVHRVYAQLSKDNAASVRLLERLGMRFETLAPASYWWRGAWDDNLVYAMTGDERRVWRARHLAEPTSVRLVELSAASWPAYARLEPHRSTLEGASLLERVGAALLPGDGDRPLLRGVEADGQPAGLVVLTGSEGAEPGAGEVEHLTVDRWWHGRGLPGRVRELVSASRRAAAGPRRG